jgi:hypothetical protein
MEFSKEICLRGQPQSYSLASNCTSGGQDLRVVRPSFCGCYRLDQTLGAARILDAERSVAVGGCTPSRGAAGPPLGARPVQYGRVELDVASSLLLKFEFLPNQASGIRAEPLAQSPIRQDLANLFSEMF